MYLTFNFLTQSILHLLIFFFVEYVFHMYISFFRLMYIIFCNKIFVSQKPHSDELTIVVYNKGKTEQKIVSS